MKQQITKDQFYETSKQEELIEWGKIRGYIGNDEHNFYMTIGQMIEYLAENGGVPIEIGSNNVGVRNIIMTTGGEFNHINTLCDALWGAVKSILEK